MNKEDLEKNILILKKSQKIEDLFLCIRYLIELYDENKFNEFIEEKKSALLKADPIKFIGYHIDFYVCHERYLESLNLLHFYQETPFMKPYTTIEEINQEWQHIKNENIEKIEIKLLAIDGYTVIAEWILKQNDEEFDGIYEIKFNANLECVYFKSWEMIK